jgi:hypothetical protein
MLKSHVLGLRLVLLPAYCLSFVHDSTPVESLTILSIPPVNSKFIVDKHFLWLTTSLFDLRLTQFIGPSSPFKPIELFGKNGKRIRITIIERE